MLAAYFNKIGVGRILMMLLGNVVIGLGVSVFKLSGLGNDPFSGMVMAMGTLLHMPYANFQVILNIAVVTNTMPNTGISLPFISYGGSSLLSYMIMAGIIFNISNENIRYIAAELKSHPFANYILKYYKGFTDLDVMFEVLPKPGLFEKLYNYTNDKYKLKSVDWDTIVL